MAGLAVPFVRSPSHGVGGIGRPRGEDVKESVRTLTGVAALICAAATIAASLAHCPQPAAPTPFRERYVPELARVDSVQRALDVLPRYARGSSDRDLALGIDRLLRDRFTHGYSKISPCRNWSLAFVGLFRWDVTAPMHPDEILRYPTAACSQQAMVFQALLERVGIDYASVGFAPTRPGDTDGHFAVAAKLDGVWTYFDPNQEPTSEGTAVSAVLQGDVLTKIYPGEKGAIYKARANRGDIAVSGINQYPAPRGGMLQSATALFSVWGWLFLGLCSLALRRPGRRNGQAFSIARMIREKRWMAMRLPGWRSGLHPA